MEQKNNTSDPKRKSDERIWRENEYMGRVLGEKVRELNKLKTRFEKKLEKEKEKFAVQHLNVNSFTGSKTGGRRKKISLTVEPYKFLLEQKAEEDKKKDKSNELFHFANKHKLNIRSTSVPNLAQLLESDTENESFLPPIYNNKERCKIQSKETLKVPSNDGKQTAQSRFGVNLDVKLSDRESANVFFNHGEGRNDGYRNVAKLPVLSTFERRRNSNQGRVDGAETFLTADINVAAVYDGDSRSSFACKDTASQQAKQLGHVTIVDKISNRDKLDKKYFSESIKEALSETNINEAVGRSSWARSSDGNIPILFENANKNKLAPLQASVNSARSEQQERKIQKSRTKSRTKNSSDNINEAVENSQSGFGNISQISMVKNLRKKQQLEFEHQISFLPASNRIFKEDQQYTNSNGDKLSQQDSRRLGVAKRRWMKAYNMAKQNFYGHDSTEKPVVNTTNKKETLKTPDSCSKDPRLLRLVSMLCRRKSSFLSKENVKEEQQ